VSAARASTPTIAAAVGVLLAAGLVAPAAGQCERVQILPWGAPQRTTYGPYFGTSVALDGDRVAIGSPGERAVFVYRLEGRHAHLETSLASPTAQGNFGYSIAMRDGVLVVAGSPTGTPGGGVFVYEVVNDELVLTAELVHSVPTSSGKVVSVDGDLVAVGAPDSNGPTSWTGSVTLFEKQGSAWVEVARLNPPDLESGEQFGTRVVVDEGRVAVGAPGWGTEGYYFDGSIRIFEEVNGDWQETAYVLPAKIPPYAGIGSQVALRGNRLATITPGNAYGVPARINVFDYTGSTWTENYAITSPWGYLAFSDDARRLAVGLPGNSVGGQVRTYLLEGDEWGLEGIVEPDVLEPDSSFGSSIGYDGESLVVGATGSGVVGDDVGAAYVFDMSGTWCKSLYSPTGPVSAAQGRTYTLMLDAGPEHAGRAWVLAGSSTGTTPPTPFHGAEVPLVFDAYSAALESPDTSWLSHRTGHLDENGRAAAVLNVPASLPSFVAGPVLWHAFVVLGEDGRAVHVSNVRAVELLHHPASAAR